MALVTGLSSRLSFSDSGNGQRGRRERLQPDPHFGPPMQNSTATHLGGVFFKIAHRILKVDPAFEGHSHGQRIQLETYAREV